MLAKGISFQIGDGGSPTEVFTHVPKITEITPSGTAWETEDLTNHDSTDPVTEMETTIRDEGTIALVIKPWVPGNAQHALIRALSQSGAARNMQMSYPGGSLGTIRFLAHVSNFAFITPTKAHHGANVTVQVRGALDDRPAAITAFAVTDAEEGAYVTSESIEISVTFDEVVVVSGTPRIEITLDSGTVYAAYTGGSGSNVLSFAYEFGGGDQAEVEEMSIESPVDLNGGTILDMAGQAAVLTFTPPDTDAFSVNPD